MSNDKKNVEIKILGRLRKKSEVFRKNKHYIKTSQPLSSSPQSWKSENFKIIQNWLVKAISRHTEIPASDIDVKEPFSSYSMDSVKTVSLMGELEDFLGVSLSPTLMYAYPNIEEISRHLSGDSADEGIRPERTRGRNDADIAIIGMHGVMPGSKNLDEFWRHLEAGDDLISEIPRERWDWRDHHDDPRKEANKSNIKWGGFIDDIAAFDASFFNISPREAELMDPQQRLFLQTVWNSLEDAGYPPESLKLSKVGVFAGVSTQDYAEVLRDCQTKMEAHSSTGIAHSVLPNRVSYLFNFKGPSEAIDTACSSSLVAIHHAARAIQSGDCEIAIAGGVNALLTPSMYLSFDKAGMLSEDGRCKTFDKAANGYARAEGVGSIVLKHLSRASADGDHIYGVIKGSVVNHGGKSNSLTAPNPNSQAELLIDAYNKSGVDMASVSYIEAHGTGTSLGDPIEIDGIKMAYEKSAGRSKRQNQCGIGSVKTNIGHMEAAAGIAGVIKVLLAMRHRTLPANVHFKELNPYIKLKDTPFYIVSETRPWKNMKDESGDIIPRMAGVSSFGFGGTNAHIIIEEAPPKTAISEKRRPYHFITLSAKTKACLKQKLQDLSDWLAEEENQNVSISEFSYTLNVGRSHFKYRAVLLARDMEDARSLLDKSLKGEKTGACFEGDSPVAGNLDDNPIYRRSFELLMDDLKKLDDSDAKLYFNHLSALADFYVAGFNIDWDSFYRSEFTRRVSLPPYPFSREKHWPKIQDPKDFKGTSGLVKTPLASESVAVKNDFDQTKNIDVILSHLKKNISAATKIPESDLDVHKNIENYGFDSIVINELTLKLEEITGEKNPALFFSSKTIHELAENIDAAYGNIFMSDNLPRQVSVDQPECSSRPAHAIESSSKTKIKDIAVIGVSGKYPGADGLYDLFKNLKAGKDCIRHIPKDRWDYHGEASNKNKAYPNWGGFISDVDKFDCDNFKIPLNEALLMHPEERLLLEQAWHCFEHAGYDPLGMRKDDDNEVGVYIGASFHDYQYIVSESNIDSEDYLPFTSQTYSYANRLSYFFNLTGPSLAIDTACSSSLQAVFEACGAIRSGRCKAAIAGGVNLHLHPAKFKLLNEYNFLSQKGRCYSFAEGGEGYAPGEGVGLVMLKTLDDAREDNDNILAVIKGVAAGNDGKTNGFTVPNPSSQSRIIDKALNDADISPETVSFVECHGTGTALGDPIEISALSKTFAKHTPKLQYCAVSSIKSNIGHLEAAAGIAQLTKVILQLKNKTLFPNVMHSPSLNQNINFSDTPFYVQRQLASWTREAETNPLRAGVSSFGAGGSNVHVIMEEYQSESLKRSENQDKHFIIPFSADSKEQLHDIIQDTYTFLSDEKFNIFDCEYGVDNISATLTSGRADKKFRLAVVCENNIGVFLDCLEQALENLKIDNFERGADIFYGTADKSFNPPEESSAGSRHEVLRDVARDWVKGKKTLRNRPHEGFQKVVLPGYKFKAGNIDLKKYRAFKATSSASRSTADSDIPLKMNSADHLKSWILTVFREIMGELPDDFDENEEFFNYGLDSITGSRIHAELAKRHEKLDDFVLIEYNTLRTLTKHIFDNYHAASESAPDSDDADAANSKGGDEAEEIGGIRSLLSDDKLVEMKDELFGFDQVIEAYEKSGGKLKMEIRKIKLTGDAEIEVVVCGKGRTVVFLPPFNSTATIWIQQILNLSSHFQVVVIHYPGLGNSDWMEKLRGFSDLAEIIKLTLDKMVEEQSIKSKQVTLVGWSFGGFLAQTMAMEYPEYVEKLILISTTTISWSSDEYNISGEEFSRKSTLEFRANHSRLPAFLKNTPHIMSLLEQDKMESFVLGTSNRRVIERYFLMIARFRHLDVAKLVEVPTYLISGSDDELMPAEFAMKLSAEIKNSVYYEVEGGQHFMSLFRHDIINEKLLAWIGKDEVENSCDPSVSEEIPKENMKLTIP